MAIAHAKFRKIKAISQTLENGQRPTDALTGIPTPRKMSEDINKCKQLPH